jgi:hypothetical protein
MLRKEADASGEDSFTRHCLATKKAFRCCGAAPAVEALVLLTPQEWHRFPDTLISREIGGGSNRQQRQGYG